MREHHQVTNRQETIAAQQEQAVAPSMGHTKKKKLALLVMAPRLVKLA